MEEIKKPIQKKCYNCQYKGEYFRIKSIKATQHHCNHPKFTEEDMKNGVISPWDTLREFWDTCEDFKLKEQQ